MDKYQIELIQRISNINPILDEVLYKKVILQEGYDRIRAVPISQEKVRELYSGCLKGGRSCKNIFYQSLVRNEPYLIDSLWREVVG